MIKSRWFDYRCTLLQMIRKRESVTRDLIAVFRFAVFQLADAGFKLGYSLGFGGLVFAGREAVKACF